MPYGRRPRGRRAPQRGRYPDGPLVRDRMNQSPPTKLQHDPVAAIADARRRGEPSGAGSESASAAGDPSELRRALHHAVRPEVWEATLTDAQRLQLARMRFLLGGGARGGDDALIGRILVSLGRHVLDLEEHERAAKATRPANAERVTKLVHTIAVLRAAGKYITDTFAPPKDQKP